MSEDTKQKNILVTGGAGFIGAHVSHALQARGDTVVVLDNFTDFLYPKEYKKDRWGHIFSDKSDQPEVIEGSIMDSDLLESVVKEHNIDTIIHLAAHPNPGFSVGKAEEYESVNTLGTIKVLQAAVAGDVKQFIFAGSSSVYNDEQTPFCEDMYPLRPRSPYGVSKAAAEAYVTMWHDLYDLPVTILRFFSVYGPFGRPDMAPNIFAEKVLKEETIELTPNRERDFTYIDDTVNGILLAVDTPFDYELFNLGRGEPTGLREFIAGIEQASGKTATIIDRKEPPGEMRVTYSDTNRAKEKLGYEPKVSVEEGTAKLVEWMQEYLNLN